jgi:hypothetical protein
MSTYFVQPLNASVGTPAGTGFAYLLDSTRWQSSIAGTLQPTASLSSPGSDRGQMTLRRCVGSIEPIGQAVTALCYTLSGAGAWVHQAALDVTCPAGQSTAVMLYPGDFGAVDGMIAVQAGVTPPTSIAAIATVADISASDNSLEELAIGAIPVQTAAGFVAATPTNLLGASQAAAVANLAAADPNATNTILAAADRGAGARGLIQTTGVLASDAGVYDVTGLACDTKGALELDFYVVFKGSSTSSNVNLRINGSSSTNFTDSRILSEHDASTLSPWAGTGNPSMLNSTNLIAPSDWAMIVIRAPMPQSALGVRVILIDATFHMASGNRRIEHTTSEIGFLATGGEITSLGLEMVGVTVVFDSTKCAHRLVRLVAP